MRNLTLAGGRRQAAVAAERKHHVEPDRRYDRGRGWEVAGQLGFPRTQVNSRSTSSSAPQPASAKGYGVTREQQHGGDGEHQLHADDKESLARL